MDTTNMRGRNPGVISISRHFNYDHLPAHLQEISKPVHDLADQMIAKLGDDPELTTGLRKLLEAKDCFVRARLAVGSGNDGVNASNG